MISIIITAYNVEKTIEKAINSCINQTYKDLEIIVVEDCSTDNTKDIIKSFNDPRIVLLENQTNQGAGMSRRIGTKAARGEFTCFLDGDDWLDPKFIQTLYNTAKRENADIVSCGVIIKEDGKKDLIRSYNKKKIFTDCDDTEAGYWVSRYLNNKLVKRELWDKVEYSSRRFCEDTQTCFFLMLESNIKVNITYNGYYYYQNSNSLCHNTSTVKRAIYMVLCAKDICDYMAKKFGPGETYQNSLKAFLVRIKELEELEDRLEKEDIKEKFKDELAEIFEFFLLHIKL